VAVLRDALVDFACLGVVETRDRALDQAFALVYGQQSARIHRFLRDLLGDAALAADATQETFVRAFRQREAFEQGRAIAPWLFGIARNVSLEMRRARHRARRVIAVTNEEGDAPEPRAVGSPESELLGREAVRIVGAAVERLSGDRRAMLLLRLDHGLSYDEIAELMGFSIAKVKVEIFRAREILRETMNDYERGGAK
jgi:RNA polymerase sigma-70 factor (ECF subfamily)